MAHVDDAENVILLGESDGTIQLVDLGTGTCAIFGVKGAVAVADIVAAGETKFMSVLEDGTINIWDMSKPTSTMPPAGPKITGLEQLAEGRVLVRCEGGGNYELRL
jgi:WD40 repeat protein